VKENQKPFIPSWLNMAGLSQAEFRVYCYLASRADNKTGIAWPKAETISGDCRIARNTVWKTIRRLEGINLVQRVGKPFQGSSRYRVHALPIGANDIPIDSEAIGANEIPIEPFPIGANETPPIGANEILQSAQMDSRECNPKKDIQRRKSNKSEKSNYEPSQDALEYAQWFKSTLPESLNLPARWQASFAKEYDDMIRLDGRTGEQIRTVSLWARTDNFWQPNFMSPAKLRKRNDQGVQYFDVFAAKMNQTDTAPKSKHKGIREPELIEKGF
jgi:DNA-binding MarR family transcriptional regulator